MPAKLKCLLLDFDGVIVESNGIKDAAFRQLLQPFPGHSEALWHYHMSHNAVDRYAKFAYFTRQIFGHEDPEIQSKFASDFEAMADAAIRVCPFVPGALEFLEFFSKLMPLHLSSATPDKNLEQILAYRNLTRFFTTVSGSTEEKPQAISRILRESKLFPQEVLFIGDSPEDYTAANSAGIRFMTRISDRYDTRQMPPGCIDLFAAMENLRKEI